MSSDQALADFLDKAEDWAQDLAASLELLGKQPERSDVVDRVFQTTHNYKNSAILGFVRLAGLAHRMEDVLTLVRQQAIAVNQAVLDALYAGSDLIAEMVAAIGRGEGDGTVNLSGIIEELGRWAPPEQDPAGPAAPSANPPAAQAPAEAPAPAVVEAAPDPQLLGAFLEDAEDRSQKLASLLSALEPGAANREAIHETFRAAHDLKSASATAGFHLMSRLAHRMEDVFQKVRDGTLEIAEPVRDALLAGSDRIAEMVAAIGRGEAEGTVDTAAAIADLSAFAPAGPAGPGTPEAAPARPVMTEQSFGAFERAQVREAGDRGESLFRLTCEMDPAEEMRFARAYLLYTGLEDAVNIVAVDPPMDPAAVEPDAQGNVPDDRPYAHLTVWFTSSGDGSEALSAAAGTGTLKVERLEAADLLGSIPAGPSAAAEPGQRSTVERTTIRVDTRKLDTLWSLVAELVQAKARVSTISDRLGRGDDAENVRTGLSEAFDSLDKISGGMQQAMMETRMIPIRVIFEKFPRLVRDLSRKLHKAIDLETIGADTEIDRGIVEALSDPLMHLLRNAVDHGVEFPEDRVRHGKSERGRVRVSANQQGGRIVIEVSDDGRGIDVEAVRRKALAQGIPGAAGMDERELCELVFRPGFSTREIVSELSGRGVGMDVVATRVRTDLKGEVLLKSRAGAGTQVTLLLPLTLTIMRTLLVRGESHVFAVPLSGVETTTRVLNTEIRGAGERLACVWQDAEIPLFTIGGLLGRPSRRAEELSAVILRRGGSRACLVVDELLEEREIVIKPLDDLANHRRLFSGVSVREDGTLVFILDTSFVPEEGS
ncbi:MAG: chemotaxis protein CheA [Spirochaetes bacterium]|nr:chemotaxis protein CheA [Spirochaetota bacterium]